LIQKGLAVGIVLLFLGSSIVTMMVTAERQEHGDTSATREASRMTGCGFQNSPWPMYCHDSRHTGQSEYSTADNPGVETWRIALSGDVWGGPVIDENNNIYIGTWGRLYAFYPNGTIKWFREPLGIESTPAIGDDGIIYIGTAYSSPCLYAIYPNGTVKWQYGTGDAIFSSPVIGPDGTIFFGHDHGWDGYIIALNPDGTLRWQYHAGGVVHSSPALGEDGTVYCGSHDGNLYALYPNNGTLKWMYHTGDWVAYGPAVADDGTIYFDSWDGYLYAVHPDGTLRWKTGGYLAGTTPVIGSDGTIYVGNEQLTAIYPSNGSVKWSCELGPDRTIRGASPAISADGTIYFGTWIVSGGSWAGGEIIAVNPDGTEKWRELIANDFVNSGPAIGSDGTVYIGSTSDSGGYLHAFGPLNPNAPTAPTITGQTKGKIKTTYTYTFTSTSPPGKNIFYAVDWGDGTITEWVGPCSSGTPLTLNHSWREKGTYTIKARAKDTDNLLGPWWTLSVIMPFKYEKPIMNFLEWFLERFPHVFPILRYILDYY
jgi:outer membrane protein assembly factor BamB